jgi:hypothetical protein
MSAALHQDICGRRHLMGRRSTEQERPPPISSSEPVSISRKVQKVETSRVTRTFLKSEHFPALENHDNPETNPKSC